MILVILQNAYDRGQLGVGWDIRVWRRELLESRTGLRLLKVFPEGLETISIVNAAPGLGVGPDSKLQADIPHLKREIRLLDPDCLLACGKIAEKACLHLWTGSLIVIPHPACRVLTNSLLTAAGQALATRSGLLRLAFRQRRGRFEEEKI